MKTQDKKDSHFVDAFANFIRKFECSIQQIRDKGLLVHDRTENKYIKISGTRDYGPDGNGIVRLFGSKYPSGCWYVEDSRVIMANPTPGYRRLHPFGYMIEGRFSHSFSHHGAPDLKTDVEIMFEFMSGAISTCFTQGHYNNGGYKDQWPSQHWSYSAAFNVGRHLFNKHFVPQNPGVVKLPYLIPPQLKKVLV